MYGLCDVNGCVEPTLMSWRPLTERRGRQICEFHWLRHSEEKWAEAGSVTGCLIVRLSPIHYHSCFTFHL